MLRIKQNLPARSRKSGEAPIPRMGKGLPGFGIERTPFHEGVSVLDHQATLAGHQNVVLVKRLITIILLDMIRSKVKHIVFSFDFDIENVDVRQVAFAALQLNQYKQNKR